MSRTPAVSLRDLARYWRDPLGLMAERTLGQPNATGRIKGIFFTGNPEVAHHVTHGNRANYEKGGPAYFWLPHMIGKGLLTSEGELWKRQRRKIQPSLGPNRLPGYVPGMAEICGEMVGELESHAQDGRPFDVLPWLMDTTFRLVAECLMGMELRDRVSQDRSALVELTNWVNGRLHVHPSLYRFFRAGPRLPIPENLRFWSARRRLWKLVEETVNARRASGELGDDLLGGLLAAEEAAPPEHRSEVQIRDEIMTLFLAGTETSGVTMSWVLHFLGRNPGIREAVEQEVDRVLAGRAPGVEDLPNLDLTRRICDETLRLRPPVVAMAAKSVGKDSFAGYRVPPRSRVVVLLPALHRNPEHWRDPEVFDPDRFLPEVKEGRNRFAYLPFGYGPRACAGAAFALQEMQILLASVVQRYRLEPASDAPIQVRIGFTARPRSGVPMIAHRRDGASATA